MTENDPLFWCSDHDIPRYHCGCSESPGALVPPPDDADPGPIQFCRMEEDGRVTIRTLDAVILMACNVPVRPGLRRRIDEHVKWMRETLPWSGGAG